MAFLVAEEIFRSNTDYAIGDTDQIRGTWKYCSTLPNLYVFADDKIKVGQPVYVADKDGQGTAGVYVLTDYANRGNANGWSELIFGGGQVDWADVLNKPSAFTPSAHTHTESEITDLDKYTQAQVDAFLATKLNAVDFDNHINDLNNPHGTTLEEARAESNVISGPINANNNTIQNLPNATNPGDAVNKDDLDSHTNDTNNPHSVTKTQVGLSNVDNTSDANKPVSTAQQTALDAKIDSTEKGSSNGVAELDATGKVPSAQLPAFVDDVVEAADFASLPGTGETGKIYVTLDDNKTYRWSGSAYVEISASLALGESSTTAYRGDRGKIAYDHSQLTSGNPHSVTKSDVGLGNVDNTSDLDKPISTATQTALDAKADDADLTSHTSNTSNPHSVTKTQVGLSNVDNTADIDKPVSTAQAAAIQVVQDDIDAHEARTDNPHFVTKTQVGLGNVPDLNTTDAVNKAHDQNTDTGTTQESFIIDSDSAQPLRVKNVSGIAEVRDNSDTARVDFRAREVFVDQRSLQTTIDVSGNVVVSLTDRFDIDWTLNGDVTEVEFLNGYRGQEVTIRVTKDQDYRVIEFAQPYDATTGAAVDDYVLYDNKVYKCTTLQAAGAIDLANFTLYVKFERDVLPVLTYGTDKIDKLTVTKESNYFLISIQHDV